MSAQVLKQPSESYAIGIEFAGKLPAGATLASGTVSAIRLDTEATDNAVLASTTATISGTQALVKVQAGTAGITYKITFVVTLSNTDILEEDLILKVVNL